MQLEARQGGRQKTVFCIPKKENQGPNWSSRVDASLKTIQIYVSNHIPQLCNLPLYLPVLWILTAVSQKAQAASNISGILVRCGKSRLEQNQAINTDNEIAKCRAGEVGEDTEATRR